MTIVRIGFGVWLLLTGSGPGFAVVPDAPRDIHVAPPGADTRTPAVPPSRPNMRVDRGEMLYENHCQDCHQSLVHIRGHRRANSVEAIRAWVSRWAEERELGWDEEAIRAVTDYLNRRYYQFGIPDKK